jgi:hypothetical protein
MFVFAKSHVVGHFRKAYHLARLFHYFSKRIIQTHVRTITIYVTNHELKHYCDIDSIDCARCPRERGKLFGTHFLQDGEHLESTEQHAAAVMLIISSCFARIASLIANFLRIIKLENLFP